LAVFGMAFVVAEAEQQEKITSGDFTYVLQEDGTVKITKYTGEEETLTIPGEIDGKKVTSIGYDAFFLCAYVKHITIPEGVTSFDDNALAGCHGLESVTIPDSLTEVGRNPFAVCFRLKDIQVSPDHPALELIDGVLFEKAEKRLVFFPYTLGITNYEIPKGTRVIGANAFSNCNDLKSIIIPDSVTKIDDCAFEGCKNLKNISIPGSVTSIGKSAFFSCHSLFFITIPDGVLSLGESVFGDCKSLFTVTIPDSVTSIGKDAFYKCYVVTCTVGRGSYAQAYCEENGIEYTFAE